MTQALETILAPDNKETLRGLLQRSVDHDAARFGLSPRQATILNCMLDGMGMKQICALLNISVGTYKTHCEKLYEKLGVQCRYEAIAKVLGRLP